MNLEDVRTASVIKIQRFWRNCVRQKALFSNLYKLCKLITLRTNVAKEMISTEVSYCKSLSSICQNFLIPMRDEEVSTKEELAKIFSNIESIVELHESSIQSLQKADLNHIGAVFSRMVPFLKLYKDYCALYSKSISTLEKKRTTNSKLSAFLAKRAESVGGLVNELPTLLIMPIQRIPRYKMLFGELQKYTPKEHSDYQAILQCLNKTSEVADFINESVRERENMECMIQLQKKLFGTYPPLVHPKRKLILEGTLTKVCRKTTKRRYFFLLTDYLFYTIKIETGDVLQYFVHRYFELSKCKLVNVPDTDKQKHTFQIMNNKKSFEVFCDTENEKSNWVKVIQTTIENSASSAPTFLRNTTIEETEEVDSVPIWIPDKDASNCMICSFKFTVLNRRHHCRKCGKVVCGLCSDQKMRVSRLGKKDVRVCTNCYLEAQNSDSPYDSPVSGSPPSIRFNSDTTKTVNVIISYDDDNNNNGNHISNGMDEIGPSSQVLARTTSSFLGNSYRPYSQLSPLSSGTNLSTRLAHSSLHRRSVSGDAATSLRNNYKSASSSSPDSPEVSVSVSVSGSYKFSTTKSRSKNKSSLSFIGVSRSTCSLPFSSSLDSSQETTADPIPNPIKPEKSQIQISHIETNTESPSIVIQTVAVAEAEVEAEIKMETVPLDVPTIVSENVLGEEPIEVTSRTNEAPLPSTSSSSPTIHQKNLTWSRTRQGQGAGSLRYSVIVCSANRIPAPKPPRPKSLRNSVFLVKTAQPHLSSSSTQGRLNIGLSKSSPLSISSSEPPSVALTTEIGTGTDGFANNNDCIASQSVGLCPSSPEVTKKTIESNLNLPNSFETEVS